jgi:hypothetical protein
MAYRIQRAFRPKFAIARPHTPVKENTWTSIAIDIMKSLNVKCEVEAVSNTISLWRISFEQHKARRTNKEVCFKITM